MAKDKEPDVPHCGNCAYAHIEPDDVIPYAECHRHPPVLFSSKHLDDWEDCDVDLVRLASRWPRIATTDWCGDWKLEPSG